MKAGGQHTMRPLYTIGRSNHPLRAFLALLQRHAVRTVSDVRSAPYSRFNPQYCYGALRSSLAACGFLPNSSRRAKHSKRGSPW